MLFRFGPRHRAAGWLLTLLGLVALAVGGRGSPDRCTGPARLGVGGPDRSGRRYGPGALDAAGSVRLSSSPAVA